MSKGFFGRSKSASPLGEEAHFPLNSGPPTSAAASPPPTRSKKPADTSLVNKQQPYISRIQRWGQAKFYEYINDPFHTLLNLPWHRFIVVFFAVYILMYLVFAFIYYLQSDECIYNKNNSFQRALWLSSRTASTLGYDKISPNPDCPATNVTVMIQVIAASLVNYFMLGLVFARFSAPFKRASTVRFSTIMTVAPEPGSSYWTLTIRVANLRKHQLLRPNLRLLLTIADSTNPSDYRFMPLQVEDAAQQETAIELGFPAQVRHVIGPTSPLYQVSVAELESRMMELLLFVDGMDAMTSRHLTARHGYGPSDIQLGAQFTPLYLEVRAGKTGLDFGQFDSTMPMEFGRAGGVHYFGRRSAEDMKHLTFKRLAENTNIESEAATGSDNSVHGGSHKHTTVALGHTEVIINASNAGGASSSGVVGSLGEVQLHDMNA